MKEPEYKIGDIVLLISQKEFLKLGLGDRTSWRTYIRPWRGKALTIKKIHEWGGRRSQFELEHGKEPIHTIFYENEFKLIQRKS